MRARIYVAGALDDPSFPEDMKTRLADAFVRAGVIHTIETYDAKHGWVFRDFAVYDRSAAELHWKAMTSHFAAAFES